MVPILALCWSTLGWATAPVASHMVFPEPHLAAEGEARPTVPGLHSVAAVIAAPVDVKAFQGLITTVPHAPGERSLGWNLAVSRQPDSHHAQKASLVLKSLPITTFLMTPGPSLSRSFFCPQAVLLLKWTSLNNEYVTH